MHELFRFTERIQVNLTIASMINDSCVERLVDVKHGRFLVNNHYDFTL